MTGNSSDSLPPQEPTPAGIGTRLRNFAIAIVAILLGTALFFGFKADTAPGLLSAMAEDVVPLEVALTNGKPTLMEFYANWCTSCQAMASEMEALKQQYSDRVNFVMLNVDNSKWLPEILHYRVDGIPHFVFLDAAGGAIAQTIGEQPRTVMEANLVALADHSPLPYAQSSGETSAFSAPVTPAKASTTDPRSHSSQVVN
ncbi:MAG: thioredoxin family protein [Oscillatoriales cyanobacterium C42_A2020_001]|nr:thioredoxin family protein [Leptolyngbyaceae cyanobacterium C42_A2020_001]